MQDDEQTEEEILAHAEGPVAVAYEWFEAVVRDGNYRLALSISDPNFRLARAQAWLYNNRRAPDLRGLDLERLATTFAEPTCTHPLWAEFSDTEVSLYQTTWEEWKPGEVGFASRPRPMGVDYELVLFIKTTEEKRFDEPTQIRALAFLMRHVDGRWLVAQAGGDTPPTPGWPPEFPNGQFAG